MSRAYEIIFIRQWGVRLADMISYLRDFFEGLNIEFTYFEDEGFEITTLLFYSDGEDNLDEIFHHLLKLDLFTSRTIIRKLSLKEKIEFRPEAALNSIVFNREVPLNPLWLVPSGVGYLGISESGNIGSVQFKDIILPDVVYKYRWWDDELNRRVLTDNELYFAPPSSFKDIHECNLPLRHDLVTPTLRRKFIKSSFQRRFPNLSKKKLKKLVEDQMKNSPYNNPNHRKKVEEEYRELLDDRLGVLSLTPSGNDPDLWRYFGGNSTGISVGFDSKKLFEDNMVFGHAGPVEYYERGKAPFIIPFNLTSKDRIKAFHRNVFSLQNDFEHEKEYRISKLDPPSRAVKYDPKALKEVVLGANMPKAHRQDVINIVRDKYPNAVLYDSVVRPNGAMEKVVINDN